MSDRGQPGGRHSYTDVGAPVAVSGIPRGVQPLEQRFTILGLLGRGGMGSVLHAREKTSGREVALKQLRYPERAHDRAALEALFEREFRTLAELQHPRVIRVFDYGIDPAGPYYTMELLAGASLAESSPLPWRQACALVHDVCSSLALLHSRRLLHRDVTPANVRRTADGRAKLIDFGGMAVMGANLPLIGTLGFTAPEALDRLTLDARTDLFSLGALLYFVLTGRNPYPAQSFLEQRAAWTVPAAPPSSFVADIPQRLDTLVLSLLSLEPAGRPRTAWEVMQPLAAWAGLARDEDIDASRVYLGTPSLVGRDALLAGVRRQVRRAARRRGRAILFEGEPGSGRTRLLDAAAWAAQTQGALIVRAGGRSAGQAPFALLSAVTSQLLERAPELFTPDSLPADCALLFEADGPQLRLRPLVAQTPAERTRVEEAFASLWLGLADRRLIALAVDDVDHVDAGSGGWLATLADAMRHHSLVLFCSCELRDGGADPAASVIAKRSRCHVIAPLTAAEVEQLIGSIFGAVAHVSLLADRIVRIAGGNPGACIELARSLVEQKLVRYDAGTWVLPAVLELRELPSTIEQAFASRVAALSLPARLLAGYHVLSRYGALTHAEQAQLLGDPQAVAQARGELLAAGVLALDQDNRTMELASEAFARALTHVISAEEARPLHQRLGELGASQGKPAVATAYHFFSGDLPERGLDTLLTLTASEHDRKDLLTTTALPLSALARLFARAVTAALALGRPARELAELRRLLCTITSVDDTVSFLDVSPDWLETLKRDSGLADWLALGAIEDPGSRLMQALQRAGQRYAGTPARDRAYRVDEAIRQLIGYTVTAIAYGARTCDTRLTRGLPGLLAPFAPLSPLVDAMVHNCQAACEVAVTGQYLQARERWRAVYERLPNVQGDALRYALMIRAGIAFGIGCLEAALGLASADEWAHAMDAAPNFIDALFLRRVVRLAAGDFEAAERYAQQAELRAVQTGARPVFSAMHSLEISIYTLAGDIAALSPVVDKIRVLAARHRGWLVHLECAEGCRELLRGDYVAAEHALARALALCVPDPADLDRSISPLGLVAGMYAQALLGLERHADALAFTSEMLQLMAAHEMRTTDMVERAHALAAAQLGDVAAAAARLDGLIARQRGLGVAGLMLGVSHEARALVAIRAGDRLALREHAQLTAACYRQAAGGAVRGRYLQLVLEARRAGFDIEAAIGAQGAMSWESLVAARLQAATTTQARAAAALSLLCESAQAEAGHVYLILPGGDLAWAASLRAEVPGEAELSHASACLQQAQNVAALTTELVSTSGPSNGSMLDTGSEAALRPCLLATGTRGQDARHVAIFVLTLVAGHGPVRLAGLLAAIGDQLLEGETLGVPAPD